MNHADDDNKAGMIFYNVLSQPFEIHGVFYEHGKFRRLPQAVAKAVSSDVHRLHANTAGGRVRFRTNSSCVTICAKMENIYRMSHFTLTGSAGFDLYAHDGTSNRYMGTYVPPYQLEDGYESTVELGTNSLRDITIHFPLYSDVTELIIGIEETAVLAPPTPYRECKPIVYYGSSITQGGCASRPGNAYPNLITKATQIDHINLGFSGSAKAEEAIIDYIKNLDMSMFVYDYDHNAPTPEYLANTHKKMFLAIRAQQPDLPIVILSRPKTALDESDRARLEIIRANYQSALAHGDRNVYFIQGPDLMAGTDNDGTVDGTHPNDYGFHAMARVLGARIAEVLEQKTSPADK